MRKFLLMGIILTGFIYALPLLTQQLDGMGENPETQDMLAVHANSGNMSTVNGQNVQITVQVEGKPRQMNLEDYVMGVVSAEIAPTFPEEAIKAQAVAARTYAAYKLTNGRPEAHADADICDDYHHCAAYMDMKVQASGRWGKNAETYQNTIEKAVRETAGEVIIYEKKPIIAVFCAAAGEKTESSEDVWGSRVPYLTNVASPGGESCPKYQGKVTFSLTQFRDKISKAIPSANLTGAPNTWFKMSVRTAAGGIKTVKLGGVQVAGTDLREILGLNSTNFTIQFTKDSITFQTIGYGHGVGLSQYGARYMAEQGKSYQEILGHYYTGTKIEHWNGAK